jgi:hypothetical protein
VKTPTVNSFQTAHDQGQTNIAPSSNSLEEWMALGRKVPPEYRRIMLRQVMKKMHSLGMTVPDISGQKESTPASLA